MYKKNSWSLCIAWYMAGALWGYMMDSTTTKSYTTHIQIFNIPNHRTNKEKKVLFFRSRVCILNTCTVYECVVYRYEVIYGIMAVGVGPERHCKSVCVFVREREIESQIYSTRIYFVQAMKWKMWKNRSINFGTFCCFCCLVLYITRQMMYRI